MRALLRLAYDGTDLAGCPRVAGRRTVCGELAEALERLGERPHLLEALSRTDAGVHARGNIGHLVLSRAWEPALLLRGLDRQLPADVRCHGVAAVEGDLPEPGLKTYRYRLDLSRWGDAALARIAWRPDGPLDREVLVGLAPQLVGTWDWRAFRRRDETREDLIRTVTAARWSVDGDVAELIIQGKGFPYRGVRSVVGAMVLVARGKAPPDALAAAVAGEPSSVSRQGAPALGLCLLDVDMPGVDWVTT